MDVHEKLQYLLDERGWTKYQLARKCGLSDATIANIFRRNTMPSIPTLEAICQGYGITLSQFFCSGERDAQQSNTSFKSGVNSTISPSAKNWDKVIP